MMKSGICLGCGEPFSYKAKPHPNQKGGFTTRQKCDNCRGLKLQLAKQNYAAKMSGIVKKKSGEDKYLRADACDSVKMTHGQIARRLGIHSTSVIANERKALEKIRNNPELKELWLKVKEGGVPSMEAEPAGISKAERVLLDYQISVIGFWEMHDKVADLGATREAMECLKEIERFQKKIADAIIGLSHVTTDTTDDNDG